MVCSHPPRAADTPAAGGQLTQSAFDPMGDPNTPPSYAACIPQEVRCRSYPEAWRATQPHRRGWKKPSPDPYRPAREQDEENDGERKRQTDPEPP